MVSRLVIRNMVHVCNRTPYSHWTFLFAYFTTLVVVRLPLGTQRYFARDFRDYLAHLPHILANSRWHMQLHLTMTPITFPCLRAG